VTAAVSTAPFTLTERQASVLCMAQDGFDEQQIAAYLRVSGNDVKCALSGSCRRMRVRTWQEAAELAQDIRLIGTGRVVA
jgi:DNA-binding NarL/FixJ family response regulator